MRNLISSAACLSLVLAACSDGNGDDGGADAGQAMVDMGVEPDFGPITMPDGGQSDGGPADAGPPDGGVGDDMGDTPDGGMPDMGFVPIASGPCMDGTGPTALAGTSGGPFGGRLSVYVGRTFSATPAPLSAVEVRLESADQSLAATTDDMGCAFFEGSELSPPFDVHVFAEGRAFSSNFGVEARRLTVILDTIEGEGTSTPTTRVVGVVEDFDVLPPVSATQTRFGYVEQLFASPASAGLAQRERPGDLGLDTNELFEDPSQRFASYGLDASNFFSEGVYVVGGSVDNRPFRNEFTPTHVGYLDGLTFNGTNLFGQTLNLSSRLDRTLQITVPNDPAASFRESWRLTPAIRTPSGVIRLPLEAASGTGFDGGQVSVPVPAAQGALANTNFETYLLRFSDFREEPIFVRRGVTVGTASLQLTTEPLLDPLSAPTLSGRQFSIEGDTDATAAIANFSVGNRVLWRVRGVVDEGRLAFEFPSVPAGFDDPFSGEVEVFARFIEYSAGADLNATAVEDLTAFLVGESDRFGDQIEFATPDPNAFACPDGVAGPVADGGYAGGAIDGSLVLYSYDRDGRITLPDVAFEVVAGATTISGRTDRNGCAQITQAGLTGPVDIHMYPEERQLRSALNVNASVVTLPLADPAFARPGTPDFAVAEGDITQQAFDDIGPPPAGQFAGVVMVAATTTGAGDPAQVGRDGLTLGTQSGLLAPGEGLELRDFSVRVDPSRATDLVALGGLVSPEGGLDRTHLGLVPLPPLQPRQLVSNLQLSGLVPLDQPQTVTVTGPLSGEAVSVAVSSIVETPSGGRAVLEVSEGPAFTFFVPAQTDALANITYAASATQTDESLVNTFTTATIEGSSTPNIAVTLPPLPSNLIRSGRTWTVDIPPEVGDFALVDAFVVQGGGFVNAWGVAIIDPPEQLSFTFPVPPGQDPLTGRIFLLLSASGLEPGVDAGAVSDFVRQAATVRTAGTSADTMP